MTQPPPSRRPGTATAGHVAGTRRAQTGGRVAGQAYAPPSPRDAGSGRNWPNRDYSAIQPRSLREAYQWWQQICRDVAPRRRARRWEQQQLADEVGISVNTLQRIERGDWVAAHNLFQVCSVLDLRVAQTVDVNDPAQDYGTGADPAAERRLARPAATDRIANRDEVYAARGVIGPLARHHGLSEPRLDDAGVLYVRSGGEGFARLWRFATVLAQVLGVWVRVSDDEVKANEADAAPL